MISENRARFCMNILDKLQDRFPIVASSYPIFEALLKRYSVNIASNDNTRQGNLQPSNLDKGGSVGNAAGQSTHDPQPSGDYQGEFGHFLQDGMGATFSFPLPFGNLFEDILLSSPPPED